ncbi:hypothetical protein DPM19_27255 [Actinomadura craniellae]|uniref:non-specific serine/threonine protein kinase n=1 Tax=Actinomadura craniellae TaxID=2231787 RepID=A0A365GYX7_9ACTN|nr:hypothetical protein DPM19_27255 [Actinomadura craniellae]
MVAGRYRLVGLLGRGGMGSVWRAHDEALDREVAIKQLTLPEHLGSEKRARLIARVRREARAAAKLKHPGIITVHDQFTDADGHPWIVMEVVDGRSLDDLLKDEGRLPVGEVARIGMQMLDALGAAHAAGITHRDIKPANVLLEGDRVVLTDFGIAAIDGDPSITATGAIMGTPAYMPPEQLDGRPATPASDLWSLGATLYTAAEGRRPFDADNLAALYAGILTRPPAPPVHAGPLTPVLGGLLDKDPTTRATAGRTTMRRLAEIATAPPSALGAGPVLRPGPPRPRTDPAAWPGPAATAPGGLPPRRSRGGLVVALLALLAVAAVVLSAIGIHRLWLAQDPRHIARLGGHTGSVTTAAFSPDGTTLATAGEGEGTVRLWDVRTRKQLGAPLPGRGTVRAIAFSPDGATLATGDDEGVRLWNARTREPVGGPLRHGERIRAAAFSPDGTVLATGDRAGGVRLWDARTRRPAGDPLPGDEEGGSGDMRLAFDPGGATLVIVETRRTRRLDVRTRQLLGAPLTAHDGDDPTLAMALNRRGEVFATGGPHGADLWDPVAGKRVGGPTRGHDGPVLAIAFSHDGKVFATGGDEHQVRLWDVRTRRAIGEPLADHVYDVHALAFSPDGRILAVGEGSNGENAASIRLWSIS